MHSLDSTESPENKKNTAVKYFPFLVTPRINRAWLQGLKGLRPPANWELAQTVAYRP